MTLALHQDQEGGVVQEEVRSFPAQGQVVEVGMEVEGEWVGAWASWEALEDQEAGSPDADLPLAHRHPTLDPTTSWALEVCLALVDQGVEEVGAEEGSPQGVRHSSTCPPTSVRPCTLDQGSTPCSPLEAWGGLVLEELDHHTPVLE